LGKDINFYRTYTNEVLFLGGEVLICPKRQDNFLPVLSLKINNLAKMLSCLPVTLEKTGQLQTQAG
jgi:hypothetical protein